MINIQIIIMSNTCPCKIHAPALANFDNQQRDGRLVLKGITFSELCEAHNLTIQTVSMLSEMYNKLLEDEVIEVDYSNFNIRDETGITREDVFIMIIANEMMEGGSTELTWDKIKSDIKCSNEGHEYDSSPHPHKNYITEIIDHPIFRLFCNYEKVTRLGQRYYELLFERTEKYKTFDKIRNMIDWHHCTTNQY